MKYVWMDETDSVFANEDSLVGVSYVDPSFWKLLMSTPWFKGLMAYEWWYEKAMYYMLCAMICAIWGCYMLWAIRYS